MIVGSDTKPDYQQCMKVNLHRTGEGSTVDERVLFHEIGSKFGTIMTSITLRRQIEPDVMLRL